MIKFMDCGIYKIENLITGDCYIGKSKELHTRRLKSHIKCLENNIHRNNHLQNAYNKYGTENIVCKVLLYCEKFELHRYEQACVDNLNSVYNICRECVDSPQGLTLSDDTKRRMSISQKGNTNCIGYKHSEDARHNMSESLKGNIHTKGHKLSHDHICKIVAANTGAIRSVDAKLRMSIAQKGHTVSEAQRHAQSIAMTGKPAHNKGMSMSEDQKHKLSVFHKGKILSEETKRRMSEAQKLRRLREKLNGIKE